VQSLLRFGLVDRLNLCLFPLLLGSEKVLADGTLPIELRLTESVTYAKGTLHLAYETVGRPHMATSPCESRTSIGGRSTTPQCRAAPDRPAPNLGPSAPDSAIWAARPTHQAI
jgi:hypothetical protein